MKKKLTGLLFLAAFGVGFMGAAPKRVDAYAPFQCYWDEGCYVCGHQECTNPGFLGMKCCDDPEGDG